MNGEVELKVSKDLIESIVNSRIQAAIVAELEKNSEDLIHKMVAAAMNEQVDSSGRRSQYSSENRYRYLEVLCKTAIQETAKRALEQYIKNSHDKLEKALQSEFKKQEKALIRTFLQTITETAGNGWRIKVNVESQNN